LLREVLSAVLNQSRVPDGIVVVDNASAPETAAMLAADFPSVQVLSLKHNIGGAGGYAAGIKWAADAGFDWLWTLDDDSIPQFDALAALLDCRESFPPLSRPMLLASKVVWNDGSLHPMNIQKPKLYDAEAQFLAAGHAAMSIRFSSFVSTLIHRSLVQSHGLPVAGYFLWNDDIEFTARLLRRNFGVMVPASVVWHKTAVKHVPATSLAEKYYYEVRNKLWIIFRSSAFSPAEKWWMAKSLALRTIRHVAGNRCSFASVKAVFLGFVHGVATAPGQVSLAGKMNPSTRSAVAA
jgi:GT2 family glycosyltransferase